MCLLNIADSIKSNLYHTWGSNDLSFAALGISLFVLALARLSIGFVEWCLSKPLFYFIYKCFAMNFLVYFDLLDLFQLMATCFFVCFFFIVGKAARCGNIWYEKLTCIFFLF